MLDEKTMKPANISSQKDIILPYRPNPTIANEPRAVSLNDY